MTRIAAIILLTLIGLSGWAQVEPTNYIYVSPDFRTDNSSAIAIRWAGGDIIYPDGFNVYRSEAGTGNWSKLNGTPITFKTGVDTTGWHPEIQHIYHTMEHMSYEEAYNTDVLMAFLRLDLLRTKELAEATGHQWFDHTAKGGVTYEYKLAGLSAANEIEVGISKPITAGTSYEKITPPDSIMVSRTENMVAMKWKIDESRSVSTVVEVSIQGGPFEPLTELPIYVSTYINDEDKEVYPDVFLRKEIGKDSTYAYRFAAVDVFGIQGPYSETYHLGLVDLTPPLPPQQPEVEVDDRAGDMYFSWIYPDTVGDLEGFMIFQKDSVNGPLHPLHDTLIDKAAREFKLHVDYTGSILMTIGAVDTAGNISESQHIQAQVNDLTPPLMVSGLKVEMDSMGIATVHWRENQESDLAGYHVYRYFGKKEAPTRSDFILQNVKPHQDTAWVDSLGIKMLGQVRYGLAAADTNYNKSEMTVPVLATLPDHVAPSAPFIKTITTGETQATITWMANVDADLDYFLLTRIDQEGKVIDRQFTKDEISFVDTDIQPGKAYTYHMTAYDQVGNISPKSNVYEITSKGVDNSELEEIKPSNLTLRYQKRKKAVAVFWTQKFPENNLGVVVYRGQSEKDLRPVSGMLRKPEWIDSSVKPGTTYYYQLRTFADNGAKDLSDIKEIKIKEEK